MLLAIKVLFGPIAKLLVEWLAATAADTLDKCYTFPFGLISSEGVFQMVVIGMRCKWSGEVIHSYSVAIFGEEESPCLQTPA